jgi:O-antigen ligase
MLSWRTLASALLAVAGAAAAAAGEWAAVALAAVAAGAFWCASVRPEIVLGAWFALSPWATYLLRFPVEKSVVTFDRVAVLAAVAGFAARGLRRGALPGLGVFELCWLCYGVVALGSALAVSSNKPFALRVAVEAILMPLALFYSLRAGFDPASDGRPLFVGALALGLSLPWVGLYEFASRRDVMAYEGSGLFRAGVVRANGPFASDNSYAIVAAIVAVFLLWLPRLFRLRLDRSARVAWLAAQVAAGIAACIPLFRAVVVAIVGALALPYALKGRFRTLARAAAVVVLLLAAAAPLWLGLSESLVFQNRVTDPSSAFSRLATYRAAFDIIEDHPLLGVGLAEYRAYFARKFGTAWYIDVEEVSGVGAEDSPHNNVLGTWAELGIAGAFFYIAASAALALEAWRGRNAAALALMLVYWVPGMTLQSGVYADLNLYYFAMLAVALRAWPPTEHKKAAGPSPPAVEKKTKFSSASSG